MSPSPSTGEPVNYVTEEEYAAREAARPPDPVPVPVPESGLTVVENEQQFNAALGAGRPIKLKGTVSLTTPKVIMNRCQWIEGPGVLEFTLDHHSPTTIAAIEILADDCTLQNFKLRSTAPTIPSNVLFGIVFADSQWLGHRTVLRGLEICEGWNRCISKRGSPISPYIEDVLIDRCYLHTFSAHPYGAGLEMTFGCNRWLVRDTRVLGRLEGESHLTGNAITAGANNSDCVFERVLCGNTDRMGLESTIVPYAGAPDTFNMRTILRDVQAQNCKWFGISIGHGKGTFLSNCKVKNAVGIGIEIASQVADPSWAQVVGCEIDGVHGDDYVTGISVDKVIDTQVLGGSLKNVSSTQPGRAQGIQVYESQRCLVQGMEFTDAGQRFLFLHQGTAPNTGGFHVAQNNVFRNTAAYPGGAAWAVMVYNISCAVRNNTAWQKPGTTLVYEANCNSPARVECDAPASVMTGRFTGSNTIYASA